MSRQCRPLRQCHDNVARPSSVTNVATTRESSPLQQIVASHAAPAVPTLWSAAPANHRISPSVRHCHASAHWSRVAAHYRRVLQRQEGRGVAVHPLNHCATIDCPMNHCVSVSSASSSAAPTTGARPAPAANLPYVEILADDALPTALANSDSTAGALVPSAPTMRGFLGSFWAIKSHHGCTRAQG